MTQNEYEKICSCGEVLSIVRSGLARTIHCPVCGKRYEIRPRQEPVTVEPVEAEILSVSPIEDDTSRCPYCAEKIRKNATKCRFCREILKTSPKPRARRTTSPQAAASVQEEGVVPFILAMLGFALCGLFFPIAWYMAAERESSLRARRLSPPDLLIAAKWIGIVGTVLMLLTILFMGMLFLAGPMFR